MTDHVLDSTRPKRSYFTWFKRSLLLLVVVGFMCSVAGLVWLYREYSQTKQQLNQLSSIEGQQEMAEKEIEAVVASVRKLIILPEGEPPIVATIVDAEKLISEQPFYAGAQDGDKVLVFPQAQKAILYSPSRNILVNVGPAYLEDEPATRSENQDGGFQPQVETTPSPRPTRQPSPTPEGTPEQPES